MVLILNFVAPRWLAFGLLLLSGLPCQAQNADSVLAAMSSQPDTAIVRALNKLAGELIHRDPDQSRALAEAALERSRSAGFVKGETDALRLIAISHMRTGRFAESLEFCRRASEILERIGDRNGMADVLNTVGMVHNQQGQYPLALESFTKALELRRDLEQTEQIPLLIENIGIIHFRQGDFKLALDFFNECLQSYRGLGNESAANKILVNLGATYNKMGMRQEALQSHQQSLVYFEKTNNLTGMGIAYNNIGGVYYMLQDYPKAIESYTKSLEVKRKLNDKRGTSVSLSNVAEAYLILNQLERAKRFAQESLAIAEQIGSYEQIKVASELLSKIYEKSRDYGRALEFERRMSQARDSLFSADKTAQISKMRAIYETEKAEQATTLAKLEADIEIGKREQERNMFIAAAAVLMIAAIMIAYMYRQKQISNRLLSEKNVLVEKSLQERETLLKEIHHRVKNNLQIISSLLSLQSKSLQDSDAQGAISESRNRVKSMSLIHEQLYQENTISGVDMKDYVERLVSSLVASYGVDTERVKVEVEADKILLDVDSAIPLGLIMNELVSNAMKYAFPDQRAGSIRVSFHESGRQLYLEVRDDGVGMDDSLQKESFGLGMVRSLMRKLKADMNVSNGKGTSVELVIHDFRKVTFT